MTHLSMINVKNRALTLEKKRTTNVHQNMNSVMALIVTQKDVSAGSMASLSISIRRSKESGIFDLNPYKSSLLFLQHQTKLYLGHHADLFYSHVNMSFYSFFLSNTQTCHVFVIKK